MRLLAVFTLLLVLPPASAATPTAPPAPGCMWAVSWSYNSTLYDVDPVSGAVSNPRPLSAHHVVDLAWDAADHTLYALTDTSGAPQPDSLFTVDPATGAMQWVGSVEIRVSEGAMAIDPTSGELYAMVENQLYRLDKGSGASTPLGTVSLEGSGQEDVSSMAFDASGELYVLDNRSDGSATTLYRLDKANGAVLAATAVTPKLGLVHGFFIDLNSGVHYVIEGETPAGGPDVQILDPASGNLSLVGHSGLNWSGGSGLVICDPPAGTACVEPPPGLRSWWPFDEAYNGWHGGTAFDIVGGRNGSLFNGLGWTTGKVMGALDLDGLNDSVQVFDTTYHNPGLSDFSIDLWLETDDTDHVSVILDKRHHSAGNNYGFEFFLYKGYLGLQLATGPHTNYFAGTSGGTVQDGFVADGLWHLVAVTVDRDDPQGIRWYVDGAEVGTRGDPTAHNNPISSTGRLTFGRLSSGAGSFLDGTLDEIEIFSRVLTPQEVWSLYLAGEHGKCKP